MVKRLGDISNQTADADADRETAENLYVSPWGGET